MAGLRRLLATLAGQTPDLAVDQRPPIAGTYQEVEAAGLFVADVALGATVTTGDQLGRLYDPLGQVVAPVRAEWAGTVAALAHTALLDTADRVAYVG